MATFKITRVYKVIGVSKGEALEFLRKAADARQDTELLEYESISLVPDVKAGGWKKAFKDQL